MDCVKGAADAEEEGGEDNHNRHEQKRACYGVIGLVLEAGDERIHLPAVKKRVGIKAVMSAENDAHNEIADGVNEVGEGVFHFGYLLVDNGEEPESRENNGSYKMVPIVDNI